MIHSGNVFGKDEQCTTTASPAPILSLQKFGKFNRFFLKKMGQSQPLFGYFSPFLFTIAITQIEKSLDVVLGIRTRSRRMDGSDKTTELWRPP